MSAPVKKRARRARGSSHVCPCQHEKFVLTRRGALLVPLAEKRRGAGAPAETRPHDGWAYLFGECGGGVKLRFAGVKVLETRPVERAEADRVRSLPARRLDPIESMLSGLDDKTRARLDAIVVEIRTGLQEGMRSWLAVGRLLAEGKLLLKKGDFGLWVERNGLDRMHAARFITAWETVHDAPQRFSPTLEKIGHLKIELLSRLPEARRLEVLEHGIPINGHPTPLEQVTYRQLNGYVRSIVGRGPRGRKGAATPEAKPSERLGLPIEVFEAFQAAMKGLQALTKKAKEGWSDKEKPAAGKYWGNVNHLFFRLQEDLGMAELLSR